MTVLASALASVAGATDCVPISTAPYTVGGPGTYCLVNDLTYSGDGSAITVATDGATIDLAGFAIKGPTNPDVRSRGIAGQGRSRIVVQNGRIEGFHTGVMFSGKATVGAVIRDLELSSVRFRGIYAEGDGVVIERCRLKAIGGSTLTDHIIPIGVYGLGSNIRVQGNIIIDVLRPPIERAGEAVGIAISSSPVAGVVANNVVVNAELLPNTWGVWLLRPTRALVTGNFFARYTTGIAFPSFTTGTYAGNTFMNVPKISVSIMPAVVDGGGNRAFVAHCDPIYELPWTISKHGRYCLVRNLSTAQTSGTAIEIAASDVVLDLFGFKVGGGSAGPATEASGIHARDRTNVVVRNGNVRGFRRGIFLEQTTAGASKRLVVERCRVDGNTEAGIHVQGSDVTVRDNQVLGVGGGTALVLEADVSGIHVEGARPRIIGNDVSDVQPGVGAAVGIRGSGIGGAFIEKNRVSLDPSESTAILIESSAHVIATRNRVTRAGRGIVYDASTGKYGFNATAGVATPFVGGTDIGGNN